MKALFPLKPLAEAVRTACGVVPGRTTKDILKNLKFAVSKDSVAISATDSETSIVVYLRDLECREPGVILLPAAKLSSILAELTDSVLIESDAGKVSIKSGRAKFLIPTDDPQDFPPTVEFAATEYLTVPGASLKRMLKRTIIACDMESTRYALGGVNFEFNGKQLFCVSTDGRRLSIDSCDATNTGDCQASVDGTSHVVAHKALSALERSIGDDSVDVAVLPNSTVFRTGDIAMSCPLVSGRFPMWRNILWEKADHTVEIAAGPFVSALRQSMLTSTEESRGVEFKFESGVLSLKGSAADIGESETELPISFDGKIRATMDPNYTLAAMRQIDPSASVTLELMAGDREEGFCSRMMLKTADGWRYMQMGLSKDR